MRSFARSLRYIRCKTSLTRRNRLNILLSHQWVLVVQSPDFHIVMSLNLIKGRDRRRTEPVDGSDPYFADLIRPGLSCPN